MIFFIIEYSFLITILCVTENNVKNSFTSLIDYALIKFSFLNFLHDQSVILIISRWHLKVKPCCK